MANLFEYSDILKSTVEAMALHSDNPVFPVALHWHYFAEIVYCFEGQALMHCNGITNTISEGDFVFIPPRYLHSIQAMTPEDKFGLYVIKFNLSLIHFATDYLPNLETFFRQTAESNSLRLFFSEKNLPIVPPPEIDPRSFFKTCVNEVSARLYGYDVYVYARITAFMIQLLRVWHIEQDSQFDTTIPRSESIHDILSYIDSHYDQKLSIADLAKRCNMSYSHFAKSFKHYYGQSCKNYIEFVRLTRVENLLRFTDYDLSYITNETGFADCSHLIRSFKKKYGVTPKQYRNGHH